MAKQLAEKGGYSIAAVSKLTGISCHALRIWERRYGFPLPHRSPSGHRRYMADQVEWLRRLAPLLRSGRSISDLLNDRQGEIDDPTSRAPRDPSEIDRLVDSLMTGDQTEAERQYDRLTGGLEVPRRIERVIEPSMVEIGERWFRGSCEIYEERCASGFLRRKIIQMLEQALLANTRPAYAALVGTIQGDRHEGGVLILSLLLELSGWRAISLGADLPTHEYQKAIDARRPAAVCVSMVLSRSITKRFQELAALRGAPVFVGGRSVVNYRGLARRHGLIPLSGSAVRAVPELIREARSWADRRVGGTTSPTNVERH